MVSGEAVFFRFPIRFGLSLYAFGIAGAILLAILRVISIPLRFTRSYRSKTNLPVFANIRLASLFVLLSPSVPLASLSFQIRISIRLSVSTRARFAARTKTRCSVCVFVEFARWFLNLTLRADGHDGRTKTRIRPKITAIYSKPLAVGFQCTNVRSRRGPSP